MADVVINVKIKNLPQIRRAFSLAPALMSKNLNQAISKSTFMVGRTSRINTPVDTGRLRASTRERVSNLKGEVSTNTNYDIFVHQGTRFMRARPYLRNALQSNEHTINTLFLKATNDTLNSIGKMT